MQNERAIRHSRHECSTQSRVGPPVPRARAWTAAIALLATLLGTENRGRASIVNPGGQSTPTISGIFRQQPQGTRTVPLLQVPQSTFLASSSTICGQGFTLIDVDIDASSETVASSGGPVYSALCESGVPSTWYSEAPAEEFDENLGDLSFQYDLISFRTYTAASGQLYYAGIFQSGTEPQAFADQLSDAEFEGKVASLSQTGYFVSDLAVSLVGGEEQYAAVWTYHPHNTNRAIVGDSNPYMPQEWNAVAALTFQYASQGYRLASLAHWENSGGYLGPYLDRRYAAVWLDGSDPYDVVAATDPGEFSAAAETLALVGKGPVRIYAEHGYQPPIGLAASFNDHLDNGAVGYSYAISDGEPGGAGQGAFGFSRATWETSNPGALMSQTTRMDVASVSKALAVAALLLMVEKEAAVQPPAYTLDTPLGTILPPSVLEGGSWGPGVANVTLRNLVDMDSGLCGAERMCQAVNCDNNFPTNFPSWLSCTLTNSTVDNFGNPCVLGPEGLNGNGVCCNVGSSGCNAVQTFNGIYDGDDTSVIVAVIEWLYTGRITADASGFEQFLDDNIISAPAGADLVNCIEDTTAPIPLSYYYPAAGQGMPDETTARSEKVCGAGGLQMTVQQAQLFLTSLVSLDDILTRTGTFSPGQPDLSYLLTRTPMMTLHNFNNSGGHDYLTGADEYGLPTSGWTASASITDSLATPSEAIDGNLNTRWTTGAQMVPGMWFQIDLGTNPNYRSQTFNQVVMNSTNSPTDLARAFTIDVSNDDSTWNPVFTGTSSQAVNAVITATFARQVARYIRIVQTGSASDWWSMDEIDVSNDGDPLLLYNTLGTAFAKNGGFQGIQTVIVADPTILTNVSVFLNTGDYPADSASWFNPESAVIDGLNRMHAYPLGTVSIVNENTEPNGPMCFNIAGGTTGAALGNNTGVIQWTCGSAPVPTNEQFVQLDMGSGLFMLKAVSSGKCVTVYDNLPSTTGIIQYDCNGFQNQLFKFVPTSNAYGFLQAQSSGLCLQFNSASNGSGPQVTQNTCSESWQQLFMLHPVDVVTVANVNQVTNGPMCFNVSGNSTGDNASIIQWTCGAEPIPNNMEWRRLDLGGGLFSLQSILSGKCLAVNGNDSNKFEYMVQYDCNGLSNQQFIFKPTSGGYGQIVPQNTSPAGSLCLAVAGGGVNSGPAIDQETCAPSGATNLPTQEFILLQQ